MIPKCYGTQLCEDYPDTELQESRQDGALEAQVCLKDVDILKVQLKGLGIPFMFLSKPTKGLTKAIYMYNQQHERKQPAPSKKILPELPEQQKDVDDIAPCIFDSQEDEETKPARHGNSAPVDVPKQIPTRAKSEQRTSGAFAPS